MKYIVVFVVAVITGCSMLPFVEDEAIILEEGLIKHEIDLMEIHQNDAKESTSKKTSV